MARSGSFCAMSPHIVKKRYVVDATGEPIGVLQLDDLGNVHYSGPTLPLFERDIFLVPLRHPLHLEGVSPQTPASLAVA